MGPHTAVTALLFSPVFPSLFADFTLGGCCPPSLALRDWFSSMPSPLLPSPADRSTLAPFESQFIVGVVLCLFPAISVFFTISDADDVSAAFPPPKIGFP